MAHASFSKLLADAAAYGSLSAPALDLEAVRGGRSAEELRSRMGDTLIATREAAVEMTLTGVQFPIPLDEVVEASARTGG